MTKRKTSAQMRLEADTLGVLGVLKMTPGEEASYEELSLATGIPNTRRLRVAVRFARITAGHRGNRIEKFMNSPKQANNVQVTRYWPQGQGDPAGSRDGALAAKIAVSAVDEMLRAADFQAKNPNNPAAPSFKKIAEAAGSCLDGVAGAGQVGQEAMRKTREKALQAERMAALEADMETDLDALDTDEPR